MSFYRCFNCDANFHKPIVEKYTGINYWCEDDKSYCPFCKSRNIKCTITEEDEKQLERLISLKYEE